MLFIFSYVSFHLQTQSFLCSLNFFFQLSPFSPLQSQPPSTYPLNPTPISLPYIPTFLLMSVNLLFLSSSFPSQIPLLRSLSSPSLSIIFLSNTNYTTSFSFPFKLSLSWTWSSFLFPLKHILLFLLFRQAGSKNPPQVEWSPCLQCAMPMRTP